MADVKPGNETTEWKAWLVGICAALALGIGHLLAVGLIPNPDGFGLFEGLALAATTLGAIGGVTVQTTNYIKGRSAVKIADKSAGGDVTPPNPT
jgi:hypothetical protein